jgi:hypothetical protein
MRLLLLGLIGLVGTASCVSTQLEALPLTVSVDANRTTVTQQDSVIFTVKAGGGALIGLTAEYGDGTSDSYATSGARTATVTFNHKYAAAGTYTVTATATDVSAGQKTATVAIRVN